MRFQVTCCCVCVCAANIPSYARPPVLESNVNRSATIDLMSPQSNSTVLPNSTVQWSIVIQMDLNTRGLAGWSADLLQSTSNPSQFDMPPADLATSLLSDFDRPRGIANPLVTGAGGGYAGTQVGLPGARNLIQLGGAQNTFGVSLGTIGTDPLVNADIARNAQVTVASGQFFLPSTAGTYCFQLANVRVNSLERPANGAAWWVRRATTTGVNEFCVTVGGQQCDSIDFNNNTVFPEDQDVIDFFAVLAGGECEVCNDIDFNNNTVFPEDQDVIDFFRVLAGGTCP